MDAIRRIAEESGTHRERVPGSTWAVVGVHAAHRMAPPVPTAMSADDERPVARALEGVLGLVRLPSSVSRSGSRRPRQRRGPRHHRRRRGPSTLVGVGAEENPDGVSPLGQEDSVMPRLINEMRKSGTGF